MRYDDPTTTAHLLEMARLTYNEDKEALLIAAAGLSTLKALASLPFLTQHIERLLLNGLKVCKAPAFLREKKKGKKKREKETP